MNRNLKEIEEIHKELSELAKFPEINPGPVLRLDRTGKVLLANSAAVSIFNKQGLTGKNWLELCPAINSRIWEEIIVCKTTYPVEAPIGNKFLLFTHVCTESMENIFVFGADITLNKNNEQKLEEQKAALQQYARFPDMNPGPVLRLDLDANVLLSNAAALLIFGEDITGKNWKNICKVMNDPLWKKIINSKDIYPVEARISDKDFIFNHRRDYISNLVFVFGTDVTVQKLTEKSLHQSEKMATLGTLAAGVAHELNNPAAATNRAANQLNDTFKMLENARKEIDKLDLTKIEMNFLNNIIRDGLEKRALKTEFDALEHSDAESEIEEWLENNGVSEPWNIAPVLNENCIKTDILKSIKSNIKTEAVNISIEWIAYELLMHSLIHEIFEGTNRISEIVVALKNYSFLGQAPIQQVNIHEGINNTLIILKSKLKKGINVTKDYCKDLPLITAYGSELNQVWTNILDNAIDAMDGKGEIHIRTKTERDYIIIEIEDNGPGMPPEIQTRIFDPFFTTKAPGKGTGLGLSTSYGIITEKHHGKISVESGNGLTRFKVILPVNLQVFNN